MNSHPPELIKILANELRWNLLKSLTGGDYRVQEMVASVHEPMNLVSYHLKKLRDDGLVTTRRSEADARDVYYSLDVARLATLYQEAGQALHPSLATAPTAKRIMPRYRVLFVCTHNSARSQMAEGLMRHLTNGQMVVHSAGSHPTRVHPDAIATMDTLGIDIRHQQAHHLADYVGQPFDYVITVCDKAREVCPIFEGHGQALHWGFADPLALVDNTARRQAFADIAHKLQGRIHHFLQSITEKDSP